MTHTIDGQLQGNVCLVTGASRTLGATIARHMATLGASVVIHYHHSEEAALALCQELSQQGHQVLPIQADVTELTEVTRLVAQVTEQLGPITILVNNVGPYVDTPFLDLALADFDRVISGNLRATFLLSQIVGNQMKARREGNIINIAAADSFHRSHSVYGLAKAGIIHLTEALALELAPEVRANAIAPDLIADNEDMSPDDLFVQQAFAGTPLNRLVTRDEVATMACLLCTPAFSSITGQVLVMDGGRSIPKIATE